MCLLWRSICEPAFFLQGLDGPEMVYTGKFGQSEDMFSRLSKITYFRRRRRQESQFARETRPWSETPHVVSYFCLIAVLRGKRAGVGGRRSDYRKQKEIRKDLATNWLCVCEA